MIRLRSLQTFQAHAAKTVRSSIPSIMMFVAILSKRPDWMPFCIVGLIAYAIAGGGDCKGISSRKSENEDTGEGPCVLDSGMVPYMTSSNQYCGGAMLSPRMHREIEWTGLKTSRRLGGALKSNFTYSHGVTSMFSLPTEVVSNICEFLHPKDITVLASTNREALFRFGSRFTVRSVRDTSHTYTKKCMIERFDGEIGSPTRNEIWQRLWFRDYGNALLQFDVGREALDRSIREHEELNDETNPLSNREPSRGRTSSIPMDAAIGRDGVGPSSSAALRIDSLEQRLANHFDRLCRSQEFCMHDFYFIFGEVYINYILARQNRLMNHSGENTENRLDDAGGSKSNSRVPNNRISSSCYMGLHGHIVNFQPFADLHPGLVEIVLKECGQDATIAFENLPHSKGARSIAQRLLVLVHLGTTMDNNNRHHKEFHQDITNLPWGLRLVSRNGRPNTSSSSGNQNLRGELQESNSRPLPMIQSRKSFLPQQPFSKRRRLPTLRRIRTVWDNKLTEHLKGLEKECHATLMTNTSLFAPSIWNTLSVIAKNVWHRTIRSWSSVQFNESTPLYTWTSSRIYYDPLQSKWIRWQTN